MHIYYKNDTNIFKCNDLFAFVIVLLFYKLLNY